MINKERLLSEFFELVQIDSETGFERKIAEDLKKKFEQLGLVVYEDDTTSRTGHEAGNLIGLLKGNIDGGETILLNCHMDTVSPGQGVKPSVKDGYVVSDGTTILGADDKAGIAALLESLRILKEKNIPHGDVQIVITVGEEADLVGAKALDPKILTADYGYAIDTGGNVGNIKSSAPARGMISVDVYGKTAHAGVAPEKGVSAITIAAKAIANMPLGRIDSETTANIGAFEGQSPLNVVCDHVKVSGEARSFDNKKLEEQLALMKYEFERAAKEFGGEVETTVEISFTGFKLTDGEPVVEVAKRAAKKIGRPCELFAAGGGSDANIFNGHGIPMVVLACGYEDIHTKNEKIAVEELNKLAEMVLAVIMEAAQK